MVTAWGYTWLVIAALCLLLGWTRGAWFAAEGAFVAFGTAILSGVGVAGLALVRLAVDRRIARAAAATAVAERTQI